MKCPKCGYVSYDYLDACRKCSVDLVEFKKAVRLEVTRPGELDLGVMIAESSEKMGHATSFNMDDDFFSAQTMLVDREETAEEEEEEEFDISLDDDLPAATSRTSSAADFVEDTAESDDVVSFEEDEEEGLPLRSWATETHKPPASPGTPVDMIDMSDLEDLDDLHVDVDEAPSPAETKVSEEDTVMMAAAAESVVEDPSEPEPADITFELSEPESADVPPMLVPSEPVSDLAMDDGLEAVFDLELEEEAAQEPTEPEPDLLINLDELDFDDEDEDDNKPKRS